MGTVIPFHARASEDSRAASSASLSNVTPGTPRSEAAATTLDQRSAGIESRVFIARAWLPKMPMASPNLAGPPKASMTAENESMPESLHQVATAVNTARSDFTATICRMESIEKRQGKRLKDARIAAGFKKSAREAALAFGWPYSTYAAHERGTRTMGRNDAEKYTRAFRTRGSKIDAESVLFPDGKAVAPGDDAYQRGWADAMRAVAAAATGGNIVPHPVPPKAALKSRKK